MGYFSNGTEGESYEARYCSACIHQNGPDGKSGCGIMLAHMIHNYDECNNDASILDILIPRSEDKLDNERCRMFWPTSKPGGGEPVVEMTEADHRYLAWQTEQLKGQPRTIEAPANEPDRREVA